MYYEEDVGGTEHDPFPLLRKRDILGAMARYVTKSIREPYDLDEAINEWGLSEQDEGLILEVADSIRTKLSSDSRYSNEFRIKYLGFWGKVMDATWAHKWAGRVGSEEKDEFDQADESIHDVFGGLTIAEQNELTGNMITEGRLNELIDGFLETSLDENNFHIKQNKEEGASFGVSEAGIRSAHVDALYLLERFDKLNNV